MTEKAKALAAIGRTETVTGPSVVGSRVELMSLAAIATAAVHSAMFFRKTKHEHLEGYRGTVKEIEAHITSVTTNPMGGAADTSSFDAELHVLKAALGYAKRWAALDEGDPDSGWRSKQLQALGGHNFLTVCATRRPSRLHEHRAVSGAARRGEN
jgi:hypothetical protein